MLGDDRVATESTIMGDIDIVLTQPSVLTAFVPDCYAWETSFLFNNADEGIKCFSSELASKINNQVERKA